MNDELMETFGQVVAGVRDGVIENWRKIVDGKMRGPTGQRVREQVKGFSAEPIALIKNELLPDIVDKVLHDVLAVLESFDEIRFSDEEKGISGDVLKHPNGLIFRSLDGMAGLHVSARSRRIFANSA